MAKIVKYCSKCEEGFAEKFSFCPNCASELSAFEMKPVDAEPDVEEIEAQEYSEPPTLEVSEPIETEEFSVDEPSIEVVDDIPPTEEIKASENETVFEPVSFEADEVVEETVDDNNDDEEIVTQDLSSVDVDDVAKTFAASESIDAAEETDVVYDDFQTSVSNEGFTTAENNYQEKDDDGYNITVIKEKNVKQRNALLLGSTVLMLTLSLVGVVYSIFTSPLLVAAIGDDRALISLVEVEEKPIDVEEPEKKKDDDEGGGGGGGGKKEKTETSKGVLANQTEKPQFPPSARAVRITNPSLKIERSTQGTIKRKPTEEPYGNPKSTSLLTSDGKGDGGGQGSGSGTGQGSGRGTGEGTGIGSGSGNGIGTGNGNGRGPGSGTGRTRRVPPKPKPPVKKGPSSPLRILSKPKPGYTDSARTKNVTGIVMLRVTFLANGRVGGVAPVKGLPHGLTQKAIAAAKQIRFKPAQVNGQARSVTKRIQYRFTIY